MARAFLYGSVPQDEVSFRRRTGLSTMGKRVLIGCVGALCIVSAILLVARTSSKRSSLMEFFAYPSEDSFPWNELNSPFDYRYQGRQSPLQGYSSEYGYEIEKPDPLEAYGGNWPLYSPEACIPQTFPELPQGFICSSDDYGVFLLDPYGNLYGRGIQERLRRVLAAERESIERVDAKIPEKAEERHRANWVSPLSWVEPSLLPNQTECEEVIKSFYEFTSSPMVDDLSNATSLLSKDFAFSSTDVALVPGCVAETNGKLLVGPDAWATAFGQTVDAFGNITSSLAGNISCKPVKNPKDALEPYMFCVAKHICTFELKSVSNSSGLPVTLEGEIMDTVWINGEGHIVKLHSDFDPRFFHVEGQNSTAPEDKDAEAKALMKSIVEGK
ncbi:hypothetical protein GUITHDRAFT_164575 [Guillardia theta CCMP2712]|uniref:Uncharacterized protein n=1 Tax=Guillardia theta (strain CCMP2712) TaxID=905079 RepID=L1IYJ3_GUITC|nr:hypothetical protein GUITHDRAFT_164575 [Guillardia theta CCMP2712]EKX40895.1 hypothetical protein GUITHDRAFT_164575 [Guillardia theta CCMP2712]|eukprot:XP_005827875.1 hypothetical protein GUITHDRAFT_164575 [Guillardia theta CCMP2712]